jgi:transcriptional regulator with XRE-family HTH domain
MRDLSPDGTDTEQEAAIADRIRAYRLALGLSKAELARYVSPTCDPEDIDLLESHRMLMPSWIRLRQLADALEVSVDELLKVHPDGKRSEDDSTRHLVP